MSPLWRDQLQVFIAPERVNLVRFLRGFKPEISANITSHCHSEPDQQRWESPLRQLAKLLDNAEKTAMTVTISNHFVRYAVLPPQAEITTPEEVLAYADFRMREIYAERVNDWVLSVSAWHPASGAICAAISRDLLQQLQALTTQHKIKLTGVIPYLVSAFDHWHNVFDNKRNCFVLVESGHFSIGLLADTIWHSIRNQRVLHNVENELLAALDQEAILTSHKDTDTVEEVLLFAPEHPGLSLPENSGWKIIPLTTRSDIPAPAHFPGAVSESSETAKSCAV